MLIGTWSRDFYPSPDALHTATYTIEADAVHYTLVGTVGMADYTLQRDTFEIDRMVGHTDEDEYYVLMFRDVGEESLSLYKQTVIDVEDGLSLEAPPADTTDNYGWNTYIKR